MHKKTPLWNFLHKLVQAATVTGYTSAGVVLSLFLVGFVPPMEGHSVRRPAEKKVAQLRPQDYPLPIVHNTNGTSFRAAVSKEKIYANASTNAPSHTQKNWVDFSSQHIVLHTQLGSKKLDNGALAFTVIMAEEAALFEKDSALLSTQPAQLGEALGHSGKPLRWQQSTFPQDPHEPASFDPMCDLERPSMEALQAKVLARAYAPASGESYVSAARRYQPIVNKLAKRFKLRPSLLFAIIHTESNFRPRLMSPAKAMGLMQILPSTAGGEVYRYLYGRNAIVSYEELARAETNITYGATYFHLLMTQHLNGVVQHRSREICAIAAYNMGIGRLMRYFGSTAEEAFAHINRLTPHQVYTHLTQTLPISETRTYVSRVNHRESLYKNM